jgi:hypothetical protein
MREQPRLRIARPRGERELIRRDLRSLAFVANALLARRAAGCGLGVAGLLGIAYGLERERASERSRVLRAQRDQPIA